MTLTILIISFCITYYIYKKTNTKDNNNNLNEKLLLFLQLLACAVWFIVSIIDFYNYGTLVFSPSVDIFIKDIMTALMVIAISMVLWIVSILLNDKHIKDFKIDREKIKKYLNNENIQKKEEVQPQKSIFHSAPRISIDDTPSQNDNTTHKGYFTYGRNNNIN